MTFQGRTVNDGIDAVASTSAGVAPSATQWGIEAHGVLSQLSIHPRQYYAAPRADVCGITALLAMSVALPRHRPCEAVHTRHACRVGRPHARIAARRCLRRRRIQSRRMLVSATARLQQLARHI